MNSPYPSPAEHYKELITRAQCDTADSLTSRLCYSFFSKKKPIGPLRQKVLMDRCQKSFIQQTSFIF